MSVDERHDNEALAPIGLVPAPAIEAAPAAEPVPAPPASSEPAAPPEPAPAPPVDLAPSVAARPAASPSAPRPAPPTPPARQDRRGPRPELVEAKEPVFRQSGAYRLRMDPRDLAKLRELPGSRDKTDRELGEQFFDAQAARLVESIAGDVPADAEIRVVVDPYSRQAFLAVGRTIRGIVSF
ncbi:MAG TPA: hypothetical protein VKH43_10165 [Thermoanaerobaculia bacterium]|nr:hypothetical protein [Thermoanaerobaculia bacterium]